MELQACSLSRTWMKKQIYKELILQEKLLPALTWYVYNLDKQGISFNHSINAVHQTSLNEISGTWVGHVFQ